MSHKNSNLPVNNIGTREFEMVFNDSKYYATIREWILYKLKNNMELTQDEIDTIINYDQSFAMNVLQKDARFVKAWVKYVGFINSNTFPKTLFEDKELVYYIVSNTESFSSEVPYDLVIESLYRYADEHSDEELAKLAKMYKYPKSTRFSRFFNDDAISARLSSIDPNFLLPTTKIIKEQNKKR